MPCISLKNSGYLISLDMLTQIKHTAMNLAFRDPRPNDRSATGCFAALKKCIDIGVFRNEFEFQTPEINFERSSNIDLKA